MNQASRDIWLQAGQNTVIAMIVYPQDEGRNRRNAEEKTL